MRRIRRFLFGLLAGIALAACSGDGAPPANRTVFILDAGASGVIETVNNILNMTVVSKDPSDLRAEYRAGFVQGKLQGRTILSARDNNWDISYLTDPSHSFPRQHGPSPAELQRMAELLNANYNGFIVHLENPATDPEVAHRLKRLLFRMLGIYHGATLDQPAALDFSGTWLPDGSYFRPEERELGYETPSLSFLDVYLLNAFSDVMDVIAFSPELAPGGVTNVDYPDKCSAFLKRTASGEIILTHNTWDGFLSQTMVQTLAVNGDLVTLNAVSPGIIGSNTDFGFNNKGIMFNETTHRASRGQAKPNGLWIFWRAALAEQFAASIDDFFRYISLDNTGTYLNGYMVADANTRETGLVEMSYRCFVYYRSNGSAYRVTSQALDNGVCTTDYDPEMVTPDYLMGINYPASLQVRQDLLSTDNRPARRRQFKEQLPGVTDLERAKSVITYTDPQNPLSIFGRWDLGYGETDYPKQIPDGSIDSKAASTAMVRAFQGLSGTLDLAAAATGFWMLYGTPQVNGVPFVWSQSSWKWQKLRDVPDRVDGVFTLMPLYLR